MLNCSLLFLEEIKVYIYYAELCYISFYVLYPGADAVKNQLQPPIDYQRGCSHYRSTTDVGASTSLQVSADTENTPPCLHKWKR